MASKENIDVESIVDPAEYFLKNSEYHDCYLKVGDPATDEVERIGVMSASLIAHSTVFRHMLKGSDLADPTGKNTHIKDVSPEVFKLLLVHMYGGQLPSMSREIAVDLTICADKYNVQPLVSKTCVLLKPTSVPEVFPALRCVVYVSLPELEKLVTNIVQQQTDVIVKAKEFLQLDEYCVQFITKQQELAITELELWKSLISWASSKSEKHLRQHLDKLLKSVRLLTLTQEEILKEVMPTKVLTHEETVHLLSAVTSNKALSCRKLCNNREKRGFCKQNSSVAINKSTSVNAAKVFVDNAKSNVFYSNAISCRSDLFVELEDYEKTSMFTIQTTHNNVKLHALVCKSISSSKSRNIPSYTFDCSITVTKSVGGFEKSSGMIWCQGSAVVDQDISIPGVLNDGNPLLLQSWTTYNFIIQFKTGHPVFKTFEHPFRGIKKESTKTERNSYLGKVWFNSPMHVQQIKWEALHRAKMSEPPRVYL